MNPAFWDTTAELSRAGTPFVVVTMTATRGYAPQDPGAKIAVTSEGLRIGTIGGGKIEARCIAEALRILEESALAPGYLPTRFFTWNLQRDVGMTCGGEVSILFERFDPAAWRIVVFGAGHVAQALARILDTLACRATFVDNRPEWLERLPKSPRIHTELVGEPVDYVARLRGDEFCVTMTRGHASDLPVLKALFARDSAMPYVGCLGSGVKAIKLRSELKHFGADRTDTENRLKDFRCPIGVKLGSNDPAEIAISVAAELLQIRDQKLRGPRGEATDND